jgi:arylsulfatase A-like enzyme
MHSAARDARHGDLETMLEREAYRKEYMLEVDYTDRHILRLLRALEARGIFERGAVVFTSDHGEEFWDHGGYEHGHSHHGEVIDVAIALTAPGLRPGEGRGLASLEDVAPTLRAVAGLPPRGIDLRRGIPPERITRAYGNYYLDHQESLRWRDLRVIIQGDEFAAYDLLADPREQHPLALDEATRQRLGLTDLTTAPDLEEDEPPPLDAEAIKELRALGYIR